MSGDSLSGVHCLVLRPAGQAAALTAHLRSLGASVTHFPTTEIRPLAPAPEQLAAVESADWLVFVSPNAADLGVRAIAAASRSIPAESRVAAVGAGTARAVETAGLTVDAVPAEGAGGAALLAHPALQSLAGQRVVIVRGEGGREELAQRIAERGAEVGYLEVYRRVPAQPPSAPALLDGWRRSAARVTIVTSVSGWRHLQALVGAAERRAVLAGALVGVSRRVLDAAAADGHHGAAAVAADPGPEALARAVAAAIRKSTENHK